MRKRGAPTIFMIIIFLFCHSSIWAQDKEEEKKVSELIKFLEFTLNTLGNPEVGLKDKNVIIEQSYLKIFESSNVQIEDDLVKRQVSINKNIQSYLKDVDILFKDIKYSFTIDKIEKLTTAAQKNYFKATFKSAIKSVSTEGVAFESSTIRYAEVNIDPALAVYKIASIYSSNTRDLKQFQQWWNDLDFEWQVVFQRAIGGNINLSDPSKVINIKEIDISYNKYITNLEPLNYIKGIEKLNFSNTGVSDIAKISQFLNLQELYMSNTHVKSLEPLAGLTKLKVVTFENTPVQSLEPLIALKALEKVVCINTSIELGAILDFKKNNPSCQVVYETGDLLTWWNSLPLAWKESFKEQFGLTSSTPTGEELAKITLTEKIDIEGKSGIVSLEPIAGFTNVKRLNLKNSGVTSLSQLTGYVKLERLDISDTKIDSLGPVNDLKLKLLVADYSGVSKQQLSAYEVNNPSATVIYKTMDYTIWWIKLSDEWKGIFTKGINFKGPLDKLPLQNLYQILELKALSIPENSAIEDLTPLMMLKNLRELRMSKVMTISNLTPLSGLLQLELLDCSYNPVVDLTPLTPLKKLAHLNIEYTRLSDLEPLGVIKSLKVIKMAGTKIGNINVLRGLNNLTEVYLDNTAVSKLSPLYTLIHLKKLSCYNTKISAKEVDSFKSTKPACEVIYY